MSAAATSALKQVLKRLPISRGSSSILRLEGATASRLASNASYYCAQTQSTAIVLSRAPFSSAAAALDEELEREALYGGQDSPSPITEFLKLAVKGHTPTGPPPSPESRASKYRASESATLKCGIPEDHLTFKTTSYQRLWHSPYVQKHEHKVTLCIRWHHLPLNDFEKRILMEIVGNRYSPDKNELKLTSNQFGSRIENKRHLTSILDRLVFAARNLAVEARKGEEEAEAKPVAKTEE